MLIRLHSHSEYSIFELIDKHNLQVHMFPHDTDTIYSIMIKDTSGKNDQILEDFRTKAIEQFNFATKMIDHSK